MDPGWEGSPEQFRAYRNFLTLALLHDIPIHPAGVAKRDYASLVRNLDEFSIADSDFVGYWRDEPAAQSSQSDAPISFYRRHDRTRALLVLANLLPRERAIDVFIESNKLGLKGDTFSYRTVTPNSILSQRAGAIRVNVPPKDFRLIEVSATD